MVRVINDPFGILINLTKPCASRPNPFRTCVTVGDGGDEGVGRHLLEKIEGPNPAVTFYTKIQTVSVCYFHEVVKK